MSGSKTQRKKGETCLQCLTGITIEKKLPKSQVNSKEGQSRGFSSKIPDEFMFLLVDYFS